MSLQDLVMMLATLAGFGGVVALLVNIGKQTGIVKDGQAPMVSTGLNVLLLAGLYAIKVFKPDLNIEGLDAQAAQIAQIGVMILAFITQLKGAQFTHQTLRGVPLLGKSFSR